MLENQDFSVTLFGNVFNSNDETALGEPTLWLYMDDDSCIEVTHEEYGLKNEEMFYSIRHHISDYDFDNGVCASTCGILTQMIASSIPDIESMLEYYIKARKLNLEIKQ